MPSSNSRLSPCAEGDEVGQCRKEGMRDDKSKRPRSCALHLFEEVTGKKHSPLGFVVRQMFSGTFLTLSEALTLNCQQDPIGNWSAHISS